jgi:tryptophan synthase alpha chain
VSAQTPISAAFSSCRRQKRAAFIPFFTAGDPDMEASGDVLEALDAGGADVIEVGVPFSDPIADGPVNQRAAQRALERGATLSGVLEMIARRRRRVAAPVVLFTYYNPLHARGLRRFAEQAAHSGVDGVLCVDLPPEEADEYAEELHDHGLDTIFLLAPTSTKTRVDLVGGTSTGFAYYVSRTGVTGARTGLPRELAREVKAVRRRLPLPLAVGFGISTPEHVAAVGRIADGVVVGSALVAQIEQTGAVAELPSVVERRVRELAAPLRGRR